MVSKYKIINRKDLEEYAKQDYSQFKDQNGNEVYNDEQIDASITWAEEMVCGSVHQNYDSTNAPDEILAAVKIMAKYDMLNDMIENGIKDGTPINLINFFIGSVFPLIAAEEKEGLLKEYFNVEDYQFS